MIFPMLAVAVLGMAGLMSIAGPTTAPTSQPANKPVNKLCPVGKEDIDPKVTYVYKGKTIGFCCEDCIPKFKADPDKYMANLK
jgi:YHS domain-containing protein